MGGLAQEVGEIQFVTKLNETSEEYQVNMLLYTLGEEEEEILKRYDLSKNEMKTYETFIDCINKYFYGKVNLVFERVS